MGYDIHITRADHWTESESNPISFEEWLDFVADDPEMRLDNHAEVDLGNDEILSCERPGLTVWIDYSAHGCDGNMAWFDYHAGEIIVKNPDDEILGKMRRIAAVLGARVQGDEGEFY